MLIAIDTLLDRSVLSLAFISWFFMLLNWGTQRLFCVKYICLENQILPRIFYCSRTVTNFMYNFGNVSKKIRYNFLKLYLSHFTLQVMLFFS